VHELGHALGMDHSLLDPERIDRRKPLMSPYFGPQLAMSEEDEVSLSDLYPGPGPSPFGILVGRVRDQTGRTANLAVIVIDAVSMARRYSSITRRQPQSDILIEDFDGSFRVAVRPGSYHIRLEPIHPDIRIGGDFEPSPGHPIFDPVTVPGPPIEVRAGIQVDIGETRIVTRRFP
jgi:hypothetical protein